jgi:hypothetical protein
MPVGHSLRGVCWDGNKTQSSSPWHRVARRKSNICNAAVAQPDCRGSYPRQGLMPRAKGPWGHGRTMRLWDDYETDYGTGYGIRYPCWRHALPLPMPLCHSATLPLCHFATMPLSATLPLFDNRRCCLAHPHVENKCDWAGVRGVPAPAHQHTSTVVACCARCSTLPLPQ